MKILHEVHVLPLSLSTHDTVNKEGYYWSSTHKLHSLLKQHCCLLSTAECNKQITYPALDLSARVFPTFPFLAYQYHEQNKPRVPPVTEYVNNTKFVLLSFNFVNNSHFYFHLIIIIMMFVKGQAFFPFLNPQNGVGPSISSSPVPRSFFPPVCISVPVLVFYLCPSSVRVVATFSGTVLFPLPL